MNTCHWPQVEDFKRYGYFHGIQNLDIYHDVPSEILCYMFPYYHFMGDKIKPKFLRKLKLHCIYLKHRAEYEDRIMEKKDQKELLINRVEKIVEKKCLENCCCH